MHALLKCLLIVTCNAMVRGVLSFLFRYASFELAADDENAHEKLKKVSRRYMIEFPPPVGPDGVQHEGYF